MSPSRFSERCWLVPQAAGGHSRTSLATGEEGQLGAFWTRKEKKTAETSNPNIPADVPEHIRVHTRSRQHEPRRPEAGTSHVSAGGWIRKWGQVPPVEYYWAVKRGKSPDTRHGDPPQPRDPERSQTPCPCGARLCLYEVSGLSRVPETGAGWWLWGGGGAAPHQV